MNDMKQTDNLANRTTQANKNLFVWTSGWLVSLALLAFGAKLLWDFNSAVSVTVIVINLGFGYKMIMANKQLLEGLDELQRRIHMNAMAISLGVTVVLGAVYGLLEAIRLITFSPGPSFLLVVIGLSYLISLVIGTRRYS